MIHFADNLFAFMGMYFMDAERMINESLTEYNGGFINLVLITAGAITVSVICIFLLRKEFNNLKTEKSSTQLIIQNS